MIKKLNVYGEKMLICIIQINLRCLYSSCHLFIVITIKINPRISGRISLGYVVVGALF